MLYCDECAENHNLEKRAFRIFYADCELCGKKFIECNFSCEVDDWKNTLLERVKKFWYIIKKIVKVNTA